VDEVKWRALTALPVLSNIILNNNIGLTRSGGRSLTNSIVSLRRGFLYASICLYRKHDFALHNYYIIKPIFSEVFWFQQKFSIDGITVQTEVSTCTVMSEIVLKNPKNTIQSTIILLKTDHTITKISRCRKTFVL
jgi:hypothetical protein